MPKLTTIAIAKLKARSERYEVSDTGCVGLRVVVFESGRRSFIVRYRHKGVQKKLTLGPVLSVRDDKKPPEIGMPLTLGEARVLCTKALDEAASGKDPAAAKQKQRQQEAAAESDTLRAITDLYLKRVGPGLRTLSQRRSDLELVCAELGQFPIEEIKRSMIAKVLNGIADGDGEKRRPVRAHRCQSALKCLLNWYALSADDYVNPLLARGAGGQRPSEPRERTLSNDELRSIFCAAEQDDGPYGRYVMFVMLTATRRNEAAGLRRSEMSKGDTVWIIPASRAKGRNDKARDVLIPLSQAAQKIVASMPVLAGGDHVFSADGSRQLQGFNDRKKALDAISGVKDWRLHDLRRTARTLLSKCPGVTPDTAERCLGHAILGVRKTYDRHDYEDEKRFAFEALATLVESIVHPTDNVTSLTKAARSK
jgi:integrase